MIRLLVPVLLAGLVGCADITTPPPQEPASRLGTAPPDIGDVRFRDGPMPRGALVSNATIARDFLDLTFVLEGGIRLDGLLRYEGPVGVYMASADLGPYVEDVEALLRRFRSEAGIDIRRVARPEAAQINIVSVPVRELQRAEPGAACIIVPGIASWQEFRNARTRRTVRWWEQATLGQTAIFVPTDTIPQEVRACLHEELAQALGPANDLYRLSDSVFNDDNRHTVVTPFDMVILRTLYSPELRSGMTRQAVAARLPEVLARVNPRGSGLGTPARAPTNRDWNLQIVKALTRDNSRSRRARAAERAVEIARGISPPDHRLSVALVTRGRLAREAKRPAAALADFQEAYDLQRRIAGPKDIRTAQAAFHVALEVLLRGEPALALKVAREAKAGARTGQDAILLSSLFAVESRALAELGQLDASRRAKADHLRWARYAYGDASGRRARELAALEADDAEVRTQ